MFSLKNDNLTYITSFVSEVQKANEKNDSNNPTQSPSTKRIKNYKSIETSPIISDKKLSSLKFPLITPIQKNKISILFDANHKSLNKLPKENLLNISDKRNKKMDMIISQITNRNNQIKKRNKCIQIEFNSNSINRLFKKEKFNSINTSSIKEEKKHIPSFHNAKSAKSIRQLFINNIEFNFNQKKANEKKSLHNLINTSSSRSQKIKSNYINKKRVLSIIDNFKKKEKLLEDSKKQLFTYSLKQFSPRLLRKKGKSDEMKKDDINSRNNKEGRYKIKTMLFKNKIIPYVDKIDIRKIQAYLPPIILGSRYIIPKKTEEIIKREEFNDAVNQFIKDSKKIKQKINLNLTKKEILNKIRQRNIQFCNKRIYKTKEDVFLTKNKIIKDYDTLKLSLNQFDNWNSPENIDNLFG